MRAIELRSAARGLTAGAMRPAAKGGAGRAAGGARLVRSSRDVTMYRYGFIIVACFLAVRAV